jgi:hypothetical protein
MKLDGGDLCGTKLSRKTIINFKCDSDQLNPTSSPDIKFIYENDCIYYFEWTTKYACVYDCAVQHKKSLYDLSGLTRQNGQFWSLINSTPSKTDAVYTNIILNVCDDLKLDLLDGDKVEPDSLSTINLMKQKCSKQASICAYDKKTNEISNLGVFSTDLAMDTSSSNGLEHLKLVYSNGDPCGDPSKSLNKTTVIKFVCDLNANSYAGLDHPQMSFISEDKCVHEILWRTSEACAKTSLISNDCVIDGGENHEIYFNLNELARSSAIFHAETSREFENDEMSYNKPKYSFQICGKRLTSLARPYLTFWDTDSLEFSNSPRLIYDNGLLYFKYENKTANKVAFVKLECSYEESLSSNSKDFKLSEEFSVSDKSVAAFVLWKTKHACLSGSNELSAHFRPTSESRNGNRILSDCVIYNTGSSTLKPSLFDFESNTKPGFIDLRILLKKFRADEKDLDVSMLDLHDLTSANESAKFYTRLCTASLKCSSFGCLSITNPSSATQKIINLGSRLNSSEKINDEMRFVYIQGDACPTHARNYSFEIRLKCWPKKQGYMTYIRRSDEGCRFHFEWLTNEACQHDNKVIKSRNCKLADPMTDNDADFNNNYDSFKYNFEQLKHQVYSLSFLNSTRVLKIGLCRAMNKNECPGLNSSSCFVDSSNNFVSFNL